jgi:hypothetical protein
LAAGRRATVSDVAQPARPDDVEGHGLGGDDVAVAGDLADAQRLDGPGVAHGVELVAHQQREGVAALELAHGVLDGLDVVAVVLGELVGEQAHDDLGVVAGRERPAFGLQLVHQGLRVGDVAVVRQGDAAGGGHDDLRLRVLLRAAGGGGVAGVGDALVAAQLLDDGRVEDLVDEAHGLVGAHLELAVERRHPAGFLAAVLQHLQAVVQPRGDVLVGGDADDAAVVVRLAVVELLQGKVQSALQA